jgi:hypothetical protein
MSLTYGTDVFMGPMVVAGAPNSHHRVLTPSTVGLEFTEPQTQFSNFCIYHFSIRNNSSFPVSFVIHYFHD